MSNYNINLAFEEAYQYQEIRIESIKSLERIKDKVKYLLIKFPQARSSDKILYEKLLQYWYSHLVVYNADTKRIQPRDKDGWSFEQWLLFPSYETMRRSRQHLQEKARKSIRAGLSTKQDYDMLPSEKVAEQRAIKESVYKNYFIRD